MRAKGGKATRRRAAVALPATEVDGTVAVSDRARRAGGKRTGAKRRHKRVSRRALAVLRSCKAARKLAKRQVALRGRAGGARRPMASASCPVHDSGAALVRPAQLTLQAPQDGTRFFIDNRLIGRGQIVRHEVLAGKHRFEAVGPGGERITKELVIASGDDREIHLVW